MDDKLKPAMVGQLQSLQKGAAETAYTRTRKSARLANARPWSPGIFLTDF
jgi:hypothetical protein